MNRNRLQSSKASGFSLVELMISISIGLLVVAAVGLIFVASRQAQRSGDGMARIQETARTASLILGAGIRLAGYLPDPRNQTDPTAFFVSPRRAISGGAAAAPPYTGIANAVTASDYVAISFVGNDDRTLRTCLGDIVTGSQRAFMLFFLSLQSGDDTPSLSCATEITAVGATTPVSMSRNEPLQQGVANLRIFYGIDTDGDLQTDRYVSAGELVDPARVNTGEALAANNWNHVTSVEITLTLQSEVVQAGAAFDPLHVSADGRLNRPIRQTVALRNRLVP